MVDLTDFQSRHDSEYKFTRLYEVHLQFVVLKALTITRVVRVAYNLVKIVLRLEAISIRQTNIDRAFVNNVLSSMEKYYSSLKIIHFKLRQSQSMGSAQKDITDT